MLKIDTVSVTPELRIGYAYEINFDPKFTSLAYGLGTSESNCMSPAVFFMKVDDLQWTLWNPKIDQVILIQTLEKHLRIKWRVFWKVYLKTKNGLFATMLKIYWKNDSFWMNFRNEKKVHWKVLLLKKLKNLISYQYSILTSS